MCRLSMDSFLPPCFKAGIASVKITVVNSALSSKGTKNPEFKGKDTNLPPLPQQLSGVSTGKRPTQLLRPRSPALLAEERKLSLSW